MPQELVEKAHDPELQEQCPEILWHFIGNCQTNKVWGHYSSYGNGVRSFLKTAAFRRRI